MTIAMFQGHIFAMVQSLKAQASSKLAVWILGDDRHSLTRGRCPHDVTARYLLMVTMDQWSFAVEGCKSVICLQAFVFADLLDVSSDGGGVMLAPECTRSLDFSAVVSRGGAMPRDSCQGWSFPSSLVLPWMLTMNACWLST